MSENMGKIPHEKSSNIEISLFWISGRITFKEFFVRFILFFSILLVSQLIYKYWAEADYLYYLKIGGGKIQDGAKAIEMRYHICYIMNFYILRLSAIIFTSIQAVKRLHDVNKSGWNLLLPFYNIYLLVLNGTDRINDYGQCPKQYKHPEYIIAMKSPDTHNVLDKRKYKKKILIF
jgi:uncharacterized membrane protein YhaH (DUF805 family)